MFRRFILIYITVMAGLLVSAPALQAAHGITAHLEPNLVSINASYNGTSVSLSGDIPRDASVLVRLSGATRNDEFLKKGRVMGFLWMNTGKITFHNIPRIYLLYAPPGVTARDLAEDSPWQDLGIGFGALKKQTELTPEGEDFDTQFREFLKLKIKERFYGVHENAVTYQDKGDGMKSFQAALKIPSAVPPGTYMVTAFILKDGKVLESVDQQLRIEESGLPALIGSLAFNHEILYGVLSILFAICAGLLMGLFFKKGGEAH